MLIEFTGCTGSGKSTILEKVRESLSDLGIETVSSVEFIARLIGLRTINNPTMQNITLDIFAFPQVILSLKRNFKFYIFALRILLRKPDSLIGALNHFRSVIRKIGVNELVRIKENRDQIIIVDEGTVHAAHNLFVYSGFSIVWHDIREFSHLVPMPDLIICVSTPMDIILERTLNRKDPPVKCKSRQVIKKYIERALTTFKKLSLTEQVRNKLLWVEFPDDSAHTTNIYVKKIVNFILGAKNSFKRLNLEDWENVRIDSQTI